MRVTLLCGFLGSGKTTLLRRILREAGQSRLAVIVNDMAALEVDGDLVRAGHRVSEKDGTLASLYSSSISDDQLPAFEKLLDEWQTRQDVDRILIETSGSSHPWPLISALLARPAYALDHFITLVDARAFVEDYGSGRRLFQRLIENEQTGRRSTENLMAEQVQFASSLFLTKTDRIPADELPLVMKCLSLLNPEAPIHPVTFGDIPLSAVLSSGTFQANRALLLAQSLTGDEPLADAQLHAAAADIGSTVISDARPFHPQRLWELFTQRLGQGIHRIKGFLWLASRDDQVLLFNQAAGGVDLELMAYWKAGIVDDPLGRLQPEERELLRQQIQGSHPVFGDRLNELTVIGTQEAREHFVPQLMACLCTDAEVRQWQDRTSFADPWPTKLRMTSDK